MRHLGYVFYRTLYSCYIIICVFIFASFSLQLAMSGQYTYPTSGSQSPTSSNPSTPLQSHSRPLTPSLMSSASPAPLRSEMSSPTPTKSRPSRGHSSSSMDLSTFTAIQVARQVSLWLCLNDAPVYMYNSGCPDVLCVHTCTTIPD